MKTLSDLLNLLAIATEENNDYTHKTWFYSFSGHVNKMSIDYHPTGWQREGGNPHKQEMEQYITEEGIQALYWFVKTKLKADVSA